MEYVSVLSGSRFTDHPRCTHPALGALARLVNDRIVDDEIRGRLALLAPDLIGMGRRDQATTHRVVACCLRTAAAVGPLPAPAERRLATTYSRIRRIERGGRWDRFRLAGWRLLNPPCVAVGSVFQLAAEQIRVLPPRQRDLRLYELFRDAVTESRQLSTVSPMVVSKVAVPQSGGLARGRASAG